MYNLLVRPSKMVWPSNLVMVALFNTLHGEGESQVTKLRLRFFKLMFLAIFAWQFMPSGECRLLLRSLAKIGKKVVAPILTSFAVLCLMDNGSNVMRVLGG